MERIDLQEMVEKLPDIAWVYETSTRKIFLNSTWFEFTGANLSDNPDWEPFIHPLDFPIVRKKWDEAFADQNIFEVFYRLKRRDGVYRWHVGRAKPVFDVKGHITHWIGTDTDIDDLKMIESNQRFLSETSEVLSPSMGIQETLLSMGKLLVKRFNGWALIEIGHFSTRTLIHEDPLLMKDFETKIPDFCEEVRTGIHSRNLLAVGNSLLAHDFHPSSAFYSHGTKSVIACAVMDYDKKVGTLILGSNSDLTERDLELVQELSRKFALLIKNAISIESQNHSREEIDKLVVNLQNAVSSRDYFLGICSHELRTPVTSLKLLSQISLRQLSREQLPLDEKHVRELLEKFSLQTDRLAALIESMLDISRIESGKLIYRMDRCNLHQVAHEVVSRFALQFKELNIPFSYDLQENVIVQADATRVDQVLSNIINNAIKYGNQSPVELRLGVEKDQAVIHIRDEGVGIEDQHLARMFSRYERFHQDQHNITGLGLGLFICKTIVDAHQGEIKVQSKYGKGSLFSVYLPLKS